MSNYLGDVRIVKMAPMVVLSGVAVGSEPKETIMSTMIQLAAAYDLNVIRRFGFDSPVTAEQASVQLRGYEYWLVLDEVSLVKLPAGDSFEFDETCVSVKRIPAYRYATLRITDPFTDPFERIGGGWRFLAEWLQTHEVPAEPGLADEPSDCHQAACLEEVLEVDGVTVMDIFIPLEKDL